MVRPADITSGMSPLSARLRGEREGPIAEQWEGEVYFRRTIAPAIGTHLTRSLRSHPQPGRPLCGRPRLGSIAKRSNGLRPPQAGGEGYGWSYLADRHVLRHGR